MIISIPKLLSTVRKEIRSRHLSYRTEKVYLDWVYRYITFYDKTPPENLKEKDVSVFLSFQAVKKQVSKSTQNQALYAILFLYNYVLKNPLGNLEYVKAARTGKLPEVFSRDEIKNILVTVKEEKQLIISLLYGCGLTLKECLSLRIRDLNLVKNEIIIRGYKTGNDRKIPLPQKLREPLRNRIEIVKYKFLHLSLKKFCGVTIPDSAGKIPVNSHLTFQWFYLFPSGKPRKDPQTHTPGLHHRSDTFVQKSIREALSKAGIKKNASCQTFRHSYAVHLLDEGYDLQNLKELLGYRNIRSAVKYKRISTLNRTAFKSPLDNL
jgi:integron integrase